MQMNISTWCQPFLLLMKQTDYMYVPASLSVSEEMKLERWQHSGFMDSSTIGPLCVCVCVCVCACVRISGHTRVAHNYT